MLGFMSFSVLTDLFRHWRGDQQGIIRSLSLPPKISFPASGLGPVSLWPIVAAGMGIGFISGFMGVGGGFAAFPLLVYLIGVPTRTAVGTSLLITLFSSLCGATVYGLLGRVNWPMAMVVLAAAIAGVQIGTRATGGVAGRRIRSLFGLLLLAVTISVLFKQLGVPRVSLPLLLVSATLLAITVWIPSILALFSRSRF